MGAYHNPLIPELHSINLTIKILLLTILRVETTLKALAHGFPLPLPPD